MNRSLLLLLCLLLAGAAGCTSGGQSANDSRAKPKSQDAQAETAQGPTGNNPASEDNATQAGEGPTSPRAEQETARNNSTTNDTRKALPYDPNEPTPDPSEIQSLDTDAEPLNLEEVRKSIIYPAAARKAGVGGTVRLKLLIDGSGRVADKRVFSSPDARLLEAAWEAAQQIRYRPATRGGKGVKTWVNFSHTF